jgi:hypothetical protein
LRAERRAPKVLEMGTGNTGEGNFEGARVLIITGMFAGKEGVCLGKTPDGQAWAISPDGAAAILDLQFEKDFGLLVDLSTDAGIN